MNAAHTPAPWVVLGGNIRRISPAGDTTEPVPLDNPANTRLIAAAPKLLDAMETVLFAMTNDYETNGTIDYVAVAMLCRSMIEQATGEAP